VVCVRVLGRNREWGFWEGGVICSWDESLVVKGRWWDIRVKSEYLGNRVLKVLLIADNLYLFMIALRLSLGILPARP